MNAYFIVDCSTETEDRVQFFSVAVEDDYSFMPIGSAYFDHDFLEWCGHFDTKTISEPSIDDLISRIHKLKGINAEVQYMEFRDFREFIYATSAQNQEV